MIEYDALRRLSGVSLSGHPRSSYAGVATNSREVQPGDLFVALHGARDGHEFLDDAIASGAGGVVVDRPFAVDADADADVTVVQVPDTLRALQELGARARDASSADVLAITGSVGKTTAKNVIAHVLARHGTVLSSPKSYNNHIGVPRTLLLLEPTHTDLVAEVGTNHPGEIADLVALVRPRVGLVTNIGHAHVGYFGSREGLAAEKAALFSGVAPGGVWVVNADDALLTRAVADLDRPEATRIITYGEHADADVRVSDVAVGAAGTTGTVTVAGESAPFLIPLLGRHFALTAAAAIAVAVERGMTLADAVKALATVESSEGRASISTVRSGLVRVIDDSYNGSPDSTLAALETLGGLPEDRRIAVLGEMRELGDWSDRLHQEVGRTTAGTATDLVFIGPSADIVRSAAVAAGMPADRIRTAGSATEAAEVLESLLDDTPTAVLIKGSRFVHTERVGLALEGVDVRCRLALCELYIHCRTCPLLLVPQAGPGG